MNTVETRDESVAINITGPNSLGEVWLHFVETDGNHSAGINLGVNTLKADLALRYRKAHADTNPHFAASEGLAKSAARSQS